MGDYDDAAPAEDYNMISYSNTMKRRTVDGDDVKSVKDNLLKLKKWTTIAFSVVCAILVLVLILELVNTFTSGGKQNTNSPVPKPNVSQSKMCYEGWIDGGSSGLGCLHFGQELSEWAKALDYCYEKRSTLLEIKTEEQMKFIRTFLDTVEMYSKNADLMWWVAGSDEEKEGDWVWTNSGESVADFVWYQGKKPPSDSSENYLCFVAINNNTYGTDCRGTETSFPICQYFQSNV